jgi:hypothetical protein
MLSNHFEITPGPNPATSVALFARLNRRDPIPPVLAPGVASISTVADHAFNPIPLASLLWHSATTGYGTLGEISLLHVAGAALPLAQRVWLRDVAVSRAHIFWQILNTPHTLGGQPAINSAAVFMETSEKRWASELLGLVFAQSVATRYLPLATQRLYYVGLYSALARAGIIPVTLNAGGRKPDFIAPSPNMVDWHVVEAKGTSGGFDWREVISGLGQVNNVAMVNGRPPLTHYISTTYIAHQHI